MSSGRSHARPGHAPCGGRRCRLHRPAAGAGGAFVARHDQARFGRCRPPGRSHPRSVRAPWRTPGKRVRAGAGASRGGRADGVGPAQPRSLGSELRPRAFAAMSLRAVRPGGTENRWSRARFPPAPSAVPYCPDHRVTRGRQALEQCEGWVRLGGSTRGAIEARCGARSARQMKREGSASVGRGERRRERRRGVELGCAEVPVADVCRGCRRWG